MQLTVEKKGPPDQSTVLSRAFCLAAICTSTAIEMGWQSEDMKGRTQSIEWHSELLDWLRAEGIFSSLSPVEHHLMLRPLGGWTKAHFREMSWRIESLGILAWALGLVDSLPPYDTKFSHQAIQALFPLLQSTKLLSSRAKLRSVETLAGARAVAQRWHQL
jgi:hypothetical protein